MTVQNGAGRLQPRGVQVENVKKSFTRPGGMIVKAIDDITLDVSPGELLVLLGPSGCGKTTLLRAIAGLENPDGGRIVMNGKVVYDRAARVHTAPERRPASMVFQSYALWPHMTVYENVAYPLRSRRVSRKQIPGRVRKVLELVGIGELERQYPTRISGGQQQRVALARAIVSEQDTILFDEPLSNVDAKVREQLREELVSMQQKLGFTAIYVTHDQEEAMMLGHRIAVLKEGRIEQLAPPREIYEHPASPYVASFVGSVESIDGRIVARHGDHVEVEAAAGAVWQATLQSGSEALAATDAPDSVVLMVRPERISLHREDPLSGNVIQGTIKVSMLMTGSRTEHVVETAHGPLRVWSPVAESLPQGSPVWLHIAPDAFFVFGREA